MANPKGAKRRSRGMDGEVINARAGFVRGDVVEVVRDTEGTIFLQAGDRAPGPVKGTISMPKGTKVPGNFFGTVRVPKGERLNVMSIQKGKVVLSSRSFPDGVDVPMSAVERVGQGKLGRKATLRQLFGREPV